MDKYFKDLINAIINNSPNTRPTSTYEIEKIEQESHLTDQETRNLLHQLEVKTGILKAKYGNNELLEISLRGDFPTDPIN